DDSERRGNGIPGSWGVIAAAAAASAGTIGSCSSQGEFALCAASTLPPPPAHPIRGLGGKCVDDPANKSANGTRIEIWSCNKTAAQNWAFSGGQRRVRAQGARRHAVPHRPGFFDEETRNGTKLVVFRCK